MRIDIWSDVVCPWCYLGKRRFESALAGFAHRDDVEVTWHSFELDPGAPPTRDGVYADALAAKFGKPVADIDTMLAEMTARAAQDGLDYHFEIAHHANTFDAHRLLHLAREHGVQDALKERLFRANFTEGRTVSDSATLRELGVDVGLPSAAIDQLLAGDAYAADVRADEEQAAELGISGVPFFVIDGRYGVSGAQPGEVLGQALDRAWAEGSSARTPAG
jgi:predicted DsbA family dithiol-disulfide isomerase